jgi:hypothetical protein
MHIIVSGSKTRVFTVFEVTDNGTKLANGRNFIIADRAARQLASASMSTTTCGAVGAWQ